MSQPRENLTATLLPSGKALIAGGDYAAPAASAELYDPASGLFALTGGMVVARENHGALLLADGKMLVMGGAGGVPAGTFSILTSAELYDPASGKFAATGAMVSPRTFASAVLLLSGEVLVTGGLGINFDYTATAELYQ